MPTAEELIVAITSEGVGETQQDLESVEQSMDETADSAGDSADELQGFSEKFAGAMKTAVAALAVAAVGILSQLPVVGEAMSGLKAIAGSLFRKLDDDLRPTLSGVTDDLFNLSSEVSESEDFLDGLLVAFRGLEDIGEDIATKPIKNAIEGMTDIEFDDDSVKFPDNFLTGPFDKAFKDIKKTLKNIPGEITKNLQQAEKDAKKVWKAFKKDVDNFVGDMKTAIKNGISKVTKKFDNLGSDLKTWASDLAKNAKDWGKDLIDEFVAGMKADIKSVENAAKDIAGSIDEYMPGSPADTGPLSDLDKSGPGLVDELASGMRSGVGEVQSAAGDVARGMDARGGRRRSFGGNDGGLQIDGRQLSESTGRYRSDPGRRRGI